jgi:hypothetical protein
LNRLLLALEQARAELGGRVQEIKGGLLAGPAIEELRQGKELISILIARLEHNSQQKLKQLKQLANPAEEE